MTLSQRRVPAIVTGLVSLAATVIAVVTDQAWLVAVAAVLAVTSVVLAVLAHRRGGTEPPPARAAGEPMRSASRGEPAPPSRKSEDEDEDEDQIPRVTVLPEPRDDQPGPPDLTSAKSGEVDLRHQGSAADGVTDPETGLFNQVFFDASLLKRVSAARRGLRPLSVAVADVVSRSHEGTPVGPAPASEVGETMTAVLREADLVARADDGRYLILLEDTSENGAVWTLERLRRQLVEDVPGHTVWVGVSCYPAYGFSAAQLVGQARRALDAAREWHQDRIEVTAEDPDD
ncbi:hypothetical protein BH23ACT2_BH23ACT2_21030 [soil metagenome]